MDNLLLKTILIISLLVILYQDVKERAVWWFTFPVFAFSAGYLHYKESFFSLFLNNVIFNFVLLAFLLLISFLYIIYKMKLTSLSDAMGSGDILFFMGLALAFPTEVFIVTLVFSMILSLVLHFILVQKPEEKTVPLAGYCAIFLICVYFSNWTGIYQNLFFNGL